MDESLGDYYARLTHQAHMERVLLTRDVEDAARFIGHRAMAEIIELSALQPSIRKS